MYCYPHCHPCDIGEKIIRAIPDRDWGLLIALFGGTHPGDHWFPRMTLNPDCVGTRNPQCSNTQLPKRLVRRRLLHRPRPRSGFAHGSPISSKSSSGSRRITPLTARLSLPQPPPPPSWVPTTFPGRYLRHPHKVNICACYEPRSEEELQLLHSIIL
ncbi:hypothetical protein BHM03_00005955 [Ensete ventricosum]|uniref:Uncharacterized protein n=1 Tax=Ensete ventricosum TaxID=4639 RepID=A0A445MBH6_ENSVE|nr:hypothetical protein BHM03_00005955 [Ensete ventricosum]